MSKFNKGDIVFVDTSEQDYLDQLSYVWRFSDMEEWIYDGIAGTTNYYTLVWVKAEDAQMQIRVAVVEEMLRLGYNEMPPELEVKTTMERIGTPTADRIGWMRSRIEDGYYTVKASQKFTEMEKEYGGARKPWVWESREAWVKAAEAEKERNQEIFWEDLMWAFDLKKTPNAWQEIHSIEWRMERESKERSHATHGMDSYWWVAFRNFKRAHEEWKRGKS